ncbi:MAG: hypothetical protein HY445_01015 [Candidatus Niyogibacteria bacterium]|nr:hypothetical protein [Candidatus Niyogibacteria bacterium]
MKGTHKIIFLSAAVLMVGALFFAGNIYAQPLPSAGGPDENTFLPLVQCEGPTGCTLCEAFRLIHRVIQFIFYGLLLPVVAIAFIIGGILLLTSAGNESRITQGKSIVWNTFIGFMIAFAAWIFVSTILVNLTPGISEDIIYPGNINIKWYQFPGCTPGTEPPLPGISLSGGIDPETGRIRPPGGNCTLAPSDSHCSEQALASTCFGSNASNASIICNQESGGNVDAPSGTDKCKDQTTISHGLFQINVIAHADRLGGDCVGLYQKSGPGTQGTCLTWSKPGCTGVDADTGCYCKIRDCWVASGDGVDARTNQKYLNCTNSARNENTNITIACELSNNGSDFGSDWQYSADLCSIP